MFACVMNHEVDAQAARLLDWRYFFVDQEGVGHATCYMAARQAHHVVIIKELEHANPRTRS
jgi:hypothetical protein